MKGTGRAITSLLLVASLVDLGGKCAVDAAEATVSAQAGTTGKAVRGDAGAIARLIDREIESAIAEENAKPGPIADDAEFLRRVALDLTGVIPSADRAAAFLDSSDPEKRTKLIDELLASPLYGRHLADIWEDLLFVRESTNKKLSSQPLADWLAGKFNAGTPWDKMVSELVTASGTQEENGATTFFIALRTPEKINDQVCRLLLGVQLQCAQCHDHPFTSWKRSDYWSMASFFSKTRAGGKKVGKGPAEVVNESGKGRKAPEPDSALDLPPKFLGGIRPKLDQSAPFRPTLAKWMTTPDNPYFARAIVNRIWAQLFGRGLVNPIDNLTDANDATHPELFDELTRDFAAGGFDLKALLGGICSSRAYQRASGPAHVPTQPGASYAAMTIKSMTPQQLYDSLFRVLGAQDNTRTERRQAARKGAGNTTRDAFVDFFRPGEGTDPTDYATGIPQVLRLLNSPQMNRATALVTELVTAGHKPARNVEQLYLATLSRRPTPTETDRLVTFVQSENKDAREAYTDLLWVLLNSSEFALNH
jgi:Protein of unknown function (DUF1549)/Protein of unknown function (DUF1553)